MHQSVILLHFSDSLILLFVLCESLFTMTPYYLILIHVGSDCVILLLLVVLCQVGEIEEQLAAARREVTKSEEANQKLQREVKEVREANLHECIS